jgi:hydroxymethylbilane synthase
MDRDPNLPARLRIATRGSRLALWQAEHVKALLEARHPGLVVELLVMKTMGDKILDTPLAKIGGKGLFTKELEQALLANEADIAVHSMKDVPVALPAGLHLPVMLEREDPRDALVAPRYGDFARLPHGAVVGTSSLRRKSQLLAVRPDLKLRDLRGNVTTRLEKLASGEFDGIVLASAGLRRLGLGDRITSCFEPDVMLPAIGQGVIGIECREGDRAVEAAIAPLDERDAHDAVNAERALNAELNGGCQVPIAGHARLRGDDIYLEGLVASLDGRCSVRRAAQGARTRAAAIGEALGRALRDAGAAEILAELDLQ